VAESLPAAVSFDAVHDDAAGAEDANAQSRANAPKLDLGRTAD